jgi:hypothetical protein
LHERGGAGGENQKKLAGAAFGVGEVNWWSDLEERIKYISPQTQET